MGKTSKKRSRAARSRSSAKNSRVVDLKAVRQKIVNLVGNEAHDMTKTATEEFKKNGNIATLKYLFEAIGLFPCPPGEQQNEDDSMTATLLERLGVPDEPEKESEITSVSPAACVGVATDAVE